MTEFSKYAQDRLDRAWDELFGGDYLTLVCELDDGDTLAKAIKLERTSSEEVLAYRAERVEIDTPLRMIGRTVERIVVYDVEWNELLVSPVKITLDGGLLVLTAIGAVRDR